MVTQAKDLWSLVKYRPEVDPDDLAEAVQDQVGHEPLDYRTRLLIRDSIEALKGHWGEERFERWLGQSGAREALESIRRQEFERPGFPSLRSRLVEKTDPEDIRSYLRELGRHVRQRLRLAIGGSAVLILSGLLLRATEDIDVVDEVPAELRSQTRLLDELERRYDLQLAHFQQHYLPRSWDQRLHYLDSFDQLEVYLVDAYDVFLRELFSKREKDLDDMRLLAKQLDRETLKRRLLETTSSLLAAPDLRQPAEHNWYILFGESLPS